MPSMSDLPEYLTSYVVQSNDIIPIDVVFEGPLAELGEPKKSIVHSVIKVDSDSEKVPVTAIEETYPDGGLRAWLVVIGCFLYSGTV